MAVQSSVAGMARGLGQLLMLDRSLGKVVSLCQNVLTLELVLEATRPPAYPMFSEESLLLQEPSSTLSSVKNHTFNIPPNLLQLLLLKLETGSLVSFFWRTMVGGVSTRL
jgi:hypothetical protein